MPALRYPPNVITHGISLTLDHLEDRDTRLCVLTLVKTNFASLRSEVLRRLHMPVSFAFAFRKTKASFSPPRTPVFCT